MVALNPCNKPLPIMPSISIYCANKTIPMNNTPPPFLKRAQWFINTDEDYGGQCVGNGLRLRSTPHQRPDNVLATYAKGTECQLLQAVPLSQQGSYQKVRILNVQTINLPECLITPHGIAIESVNEQQEVTAVKVVEALSNECGIQLFTQDADPGQHHIVLPVGTVIPIQGSRQRLPVTAQTIMQTPMLLTQAMAFTPVSIGYLWYGVQQIKQITHSLPQGDLDRIVVPNPPIPIRSGDVLGYPSEHDLHTEEWLDAIDFLDNPKQQEKYTEDALLPVGTPVIKRTCQAIVLNKAEAETPLIKHLTGHGDDPLREIAYQSNTYLVYKEDICKEDYYCYDNGYYLLKDQHWARRVGKPTDKLIIPLYTQDPHGPLDTDEADLALPKALVVNQQTPKITIDNQVYYAVDVSAKDSEQRIYYLVTEQQCKQHRINLCDWRQFLLKVHKAIYKPKRQGSTLMNMT